MNLKHADCGRSKYRRFACRISSVNRPLLHRHHRLPRCPRRRSRKVCRNCRRTSCRRQTRTQGSSRRRWSRCSCWSRRCRHSRAGCCGFAPCSSRGSKSPTSRRPLLPMLSFRSSWRPWLRAAGTHCAPAKWPEIHRSSPNEARPFIDHLSEMWNFCRQTASMLSFCSTRKVRP